MTLDEQEMSTRQTAETIAAAANAEAEATMISAMDQDRTKKETEAADREAKTIEALTTGHAGLSIRSQLWELTRRS